MDTPTVPYVGLEHIESRSMRLIEHAYAGDARSSSVRFFTGDVLYAKMRPYLNKVWVAEFDGLCSAEFLVFSNQIPLDSRFLAARLNAADFVSFANGRVSGDRPRVDFEKLSQFPILLPPLAEQGRIVDKLEDTSAGVKRAENATGRAIERLRRYRASVLHAAVTGELTRTWRARRSEKDRTSDKAGRSEVSNLLTLRRSRWESAEMERRRVSGREPEDDKWKSNYREPLSPQIEGLSSLPEGWCWMSLDQLTYHLTSGSRDWSKFYDRGDGTFLMAQNIRRSGLELSFRQRVDPPANDRDRVRSQVAKDDILVTIVGANTGDVCMVPRDLPEHYVCQSVALLRLAEPSLAHFVWRYLAADEDGQAQWRQMMYGAGRPHLSFDNLRATVVPIPPPDEREEIVTQVEARLRAADRLEASLQQQAARAKVAREALLRDAFAGKLVPQDPREESAAILLGRARTARQIRLRTPREKGMSRSRSKTRAPRRLLADVLREQHGPVTPEQLFSAAGFEPSQVDQFYRELALLRNQIEELKPKKPEAKSWPQRAHVLLQLKRSADR